jgi:hypothetical protein
MYITKKNKVRVLQMQQHVVKRDSFHRKTTYMEPWRDSRQQGKNTSQTLELTKKQPKGTDRTGLSNNHYI